MVSRTQRLVFLGIAVAIAVVVVIVVASGGGASSTATTSGEVTLTADKPEKITVHQGDQIKFKATSATADEVHLHGYDLHKEVPAGGIVEFALVAKDTGIFEIELENAKQTLGQLVVEPK